MSEPATSAPAEPEPMRPNLVMTPEVAASALEFLSRGLIPVMAREAEVFLRVRMTLEAIAKGNR